jgi:hypothetical protein
MRRLFPILSAASLAVPAHAEVHMNYWVDDDGYFRAHNDSLVTRAQVVAGKPTTVSIYADGSAVCSVTKEELAKFGYTIPDLVNAVSSSDVSLMLECAALQGTAHNEINDLGTR